MPPRDLGPAIGATRIRKIRVVIL